METGQVGVSQPGSGRRSLVSRSVRAYRSATSEIGMDMAVITWAVGRLSGTVGTRAVPATVSVLRQVDIGHILNEWPPGTDNSQ